jgi:hypothetical protein
MDVSYVGHPNLVDAIHGAILSQVGIKSKIVIAVGCADPFALARPAAPAFFTHDPGNFFVIEDPAFVLQLFGYPALSVRKKVQANLLHTRYQRFAKRFFHRLIVIICSSGKFHQFAPLSTLWMRTRFSVMNFVFSRLV